MNRKGGSPFLTYGNGRGFAQFRHARFIQFVHTEELAHVLRDFAPLLLALQQIVGAVEIDHRRNFGPWRALCAGIGHQVPTR